MSKKSLYVPLDQPLLQPGHRKPRTRREFLAQGFIAGMGTALGGSLLGGLTASMSAHSALSTDIADLIERCGIRGGNAKVPFVAFDLAGGCNSSGSNVLVGGPGGQFDFLSTAGYARQGLPAAMIPGAPEPGGEGSSETGTSNGDHTDTTLGLAFHSDSAFLRGILSKVSEECREKVNGFVMPARSENDTGNNPHNPIRGINLVGGSKGELVYSVASRSNDMGGGNSRLPTKFMGLDEYRETKVDRRADALGLVSVGDFGALSHSQVVHIMETVSRMSDKKLDALGGIEQALGQGLAENAKCVYGQTAQTAFLYPSPDGVDIDADTDIQEIFSGQLGQGDYQRTAAVMKLSVDGVRNGSIFVPYAGAGHISMGGYDYHGQGRGTGEDRDFRAGECMGAVLEYAHRKQVPVMIAVYSDGSVSANSTPEGGAGRGKFMWQGDNSNTRSQFCLVYDPAGRPVLKGGNPGQQAIHQQLGYMNSDGNVNTASSPMANNAENTVDCLVLNYMALHNKAGDFATLYAASGLMQGLGSTSAQLDRYIAFEPLGSVDPVSGELSL